MRLSFRLRKGGTPVYFSERVNKKRRRVFFQFDLIRAILAMVVVFQKIQHTLLLSLPKSPIDLLRAFRWLLPKEQRKEIDLIISDLKMDKADMMRQKRSKKFIFFVLSWHVARTLSAYVWDGVAGIVKKVTPFVKYLPK